MNGKLTRFSDTLDVFGVLLLFFAALRADGGLAFWLAPALTGITLCTLGLLLGWLCSASGRRFRRRMFSTPALLQSPPAPGILPFPKAG